MDRDVNTSLKFNQETEFIPIAGLLEAELNSPGKSKSDDASVTTKASSIQANHHSALLSLLADELSVAAEEIHDFEVCVNCTLVEVARNR